MPIASDFLCARHEGPFSVKAIKSRDGGTQMLSELLRLLRKPQRYVASFRNGEIYIEQIATRRPVGVRALQSSDQLVTSRVAMG